jgi:phage terminase large subunit-like protein
MYDEQTALRVKKFIERQKHSIGQYAGQPFILQDWQCNDIIKPLYGTLNSDGFRQYRICFVFVARKNGKTTLAAPVALYHLAADHEMGGQIYSAATDKDQASLVFDEAAHMVHQNPSLERKCKVIDSRKRIVNYRTNSFYRAIPVNAPASWGYNTSCVIYDEIHAAANRELFDILRTSGGARRQPLLFIITTAGYDRNSILWEIYDYAKKVKNKVIIDKTFLPVIYELDEGDDWEDEKNWYKANPALGTFRSLEEMRSLYHYAKENPGFINTFKRMYLNIWTSQETRWLDISKWDDCPHELNLKSLKGKVCYGGLDLSSTTDLTSFSLVFEDFSVRPFFFIPRERMKEKIKIDRVPYDVWEGKGLLTVTNGEVIDYGAIERKIGKLAQIYQIKQINYDRWNADMLVQRLISKGMVNMVPIGMGYQSMNAPTKYLESLILEKKLNHGANPILRWNFDNVMIITDPAGNIKPDKSKTKQRIDGIVATIMALDGLMRNQKKPSIYETEKVKAF